MTLLRMPVTPSSSPSSDEDSADYTFPARITFDPATTAAIEAELSDPSPPTPALIALMARK